MSEVQREQVRAAVVAVETAEEPVVAANFPALADPALRAVAASELQAAGRTLIECDEGTWISGYPDEIADRLVSEGLGVLKSIDRAVLALVLLHTVAIPRARGRIHADDWTQAEPVSEEEVTRNRDLSATDVHLALRRLRAAGVVRPGHRGAIEPGPQFRRLSRSRSNRIWEELLVLAQPQGPLARLIRQRRAAESDRG